MSPSVPNPIVKQSAATSSDVDMSPHSSSSSSSSPVNDNAVETDVFPQELLDWILANQCTSFEKMQRKTMQPSAYSEVDAMQYWLTRANAESTHENPSLSPLPPTTAPTTEEEADEESAEDKYFCETGCRQLSFLMNRAKDSSQSHSRSSKSNCKKTVVTVNTLSDWERLWTHLSLDKSDEICRNVTLFRACIRFFMHEKTLKLVWALFVYNQLVAAIVEFTFTPNPVEVAVGLCRLALFNFVNCTLYTLFYRLYNGHPTRMSAPSDPQESRRSKIEQNTRNIMASGQWFAAFKWMVWEAIAECTSFAVCRSQSNSYESISQHTLSSFDQLLNIALKFLVRHCKVDIKKVNLSQRGYKLAFLTVFTLVPVYCILVVTISLISAKHMCDLVGQSSAVCQYQIVYAVLTFGHLTYSVSYFLLCATMIISMIGLTYGSELAFHMIGSWLRRYCTLRRVSFRSHHSCHHNALRQSHDNNCSLGKEKEGEIEAVELKEANEMEEMMTDYLTRDATEQYLFIVEYLRQCGSLWSFNIVFIYFVATFLLAIFIFIVASTPVGTIFSPAEVLKLAVYVFQICLFLVFPTLSLAHVNSYINHLLDLFKNSSSDDFQLIGGKEKWQEFATAVPPAWTLFGIWITYGRITGVLSTALTAAGTVVFSFEVTGSGRR
eukprot:gene32868-42547_t